MILNKMTKKLVTLTLFLGLTIDTAFANWPSQGMMGGGGLIPSFRVEIDKCYNYS